MGFPTQVNVQPAPAVEGDFCDVSPRATVDAGPGALVAGPDGLAVGRFAWTDADNVIANNYGAGAPAGFVHRDQQGLITTWLAGESLILPEGLPATLFNAGGFWVMNNGAAAATIGMKAYADNSTGEVSFAATGTPPTGGSGSASTIAVNITTAGSTIAANSITAGSISGTTLTVATVAAGTVLGAGLVLSGGSSAVGFVDPSTTIVRQLTGTAGGAGTYEVSVSQNVASTAIAATGGGLTVTAMTTGRIFIGQTISGTGVASGTKVIAAGTGAGAAGTYVLDTAPDTAGSSLTITGSGGFLTIGGTVTGEFRVGDVVTGSNVDAGSTILLDANSAGALGLTGVGGAGTYIVSISETVSSEAISALSATETKWVASSAGGVGELVKMTTWLRG
jgi:hypothetical protein